MPGARLYYEISGDGPLLVMIAGANGSADAFRRAAAELAAGCTVVTYDRRGFSRSELAGPQDYGHRIETDADDVARLIGEVGGGPAIVFGVSSGAIVALEVLIRHPSVVRGLIPFEPPAVRALADGQEWLDFFRSVYDLYRRSGIEPAMKLFLERSFAESDRKIMAGVPVSEFTIANARYWFEHELRQYPAVRLDMAALRARVGLIAPAAGRESRGYPCHEVSRVLAAQLGRPLAELPGGHLGCVARAAEFTRELLPITGTQGRDQPTAPIRPGEAT